MSILAHPFIRLLNKRLLSICYMPSSMTDATEAVRMQEIRALSCGVYNQYTTRTHLLG